MSISSVIAKLRGRPLRHVTGRVAQRVRANIERLGWLARNDLPLIGEPTEWLEDFRAGHGWPRPFPSLEDPSATARIARGRWLDGSAEAVRRSEDILEGRFELLGHRDLRFGEPIDWHLEPLAGRRAPLDHWSRIPFLDTGVVGDHKLIWELNRHQWFVTLGRAYRMTGDERFAAAFARYLEQWMDANPPKIGINWASTLEVALRAVAWMWALHLFRDSPRLTPSLFVRALQYLFVHGGHMEAYLSTYFSPNTHLTGEALGLVYVGALLPCLRSADRWLRTGLRILISELDRQVLPDGVYFEHATWYHRYTADFYLHLLILARRHGLGEAGPVEKRLERVLDHLMWLIRPAGSAPLVGDDDGGRLLFLDSRPAEDFRSTLATGAALFGRPDWAYVAGDVTEETLWLLGEQGVAAYDALVCRPPRDTSRGFPDSGFYILRDGWAPDSSHLLVRFGAPGRLAGHAHADALSFDLTLRGRPTIIDPGTGSYSDMTIRNRLRAGGAHNTVTLGDVESAVPAVAPFSWTTRPSCETETWISTERFTFLRGRHDGFRRQGQSVDHVRSVLSLNGDYWVLRDQLLGESSQPPTLHLQFAPGTHVQRTPAGLMVSEPRLQLLPFGGGGVEVGLGNVAPAYGHMVHAPSARIVAEPGKDREIVTFLLPGTGQVSVEDGPDGHRIWEVRHDGHRDVLMVGSGANVASWSGLESDFEWLWARWDEAGDALQELVVTAGSRFSTDGFEVSCESGRVAWMWVQFGPEECRVHAAPGNRLRVRRSEPGRLVVNGSIIAERDGCSCVDS